MEDRLVELQKLLDDMDDPEAKEVFTLILEEFNYLRVQIDNLNNRMGTN